MRSQSGPRFRPAILALSGPLIPRVVFVLEGWTGASLNLYLLCPCLALSCLVLASLHVSSLCAQPAQAQAQVPVRRARPVASWQPRHRRGAISEAAGLH